MARRKRIPYDPPGERHKKRRGRPPRRADQIFMTRRMFLAKGGIVAAFGVLAAKLGYMQINQRDEYRTQARDNYVKSEQLTATRGMILDRADKELAVNRRTWEVRVIPADLPTDAAERSRVLNHLIAELGLPEALVLDPAGVPKAFEDAVYARTHQLLNKPVLDVEITDRTVRQTALSLPGQVLRVNGQDVQVFAYPTAAKREAELKKINADGSLVDGTEIDWGGRPRFASAGNILTLLVADDDRLAASVERAMGMLGDAPASGDGGYTVEDVAAMLRSSGLRAWTEYITQSARINNLVVLEDALTADQAAICRAHLNEIPGVRVMNVLAYRIENAAGSRQAVVAKTDVPRELALKLEANRFFLPGVALDDNVLVRQYNAGPVLSHILGYVGRIDPQTLEADAEKHGEDRAFYRENDTIGITGLEWTMEEMLRGHKGKRWVEVDPTGIVLRTIAGDGAPAVPGKNLKLTIDLELQEAVARALKEGIEFANNDRRQQGKLDEKFPADNGAIAVLDPRSGEVLALASYPHFDNQLFADGISQAKYEEYASDKSKPLLNHAIMETYPPGSTLKLFHAASALHTGKISTEDTFNCTGAIFVPLPNTETQGNPYVCWHKPGHGPLNVYDALKESCDIFFYNVGVPGEQDLHYFEKDGESDLIDFENEHQFKGLGIKEIKRNLTEQFWFGATTQIDLPGEQPGDVPDQDWLIEQGSTDGWSAGDTINVSIGQGYFKTTPLQLAVNTAAFANGGIIYKPLLVRQAFDDARQNVQTFEPQELRRVEVGAEHIEVVKEGMRRVVHVENGSAGPLDGKTRWPLTNPPDEAEIEIAGKTGTAEIGLSDELGKYARQNAWFTGFAPLNDPEVVVTLVIHDGGGSTTYAVPVADKVMRAYFELAGKRKRGKMLRGENGEAPNSSIETPTPETPPAEGQT